MSILHLLILLIATIADAFIDNKLIKQRKNVHTGIQYVIREGAFIVLAGLFSQGDNTYALYSWILSHIVYWWPFDTMLNILRGLELKYLSDRGLDAIQPHTWSWWFAKLIFAVAAGAYFFNQNLYSWN